jgi:hypothetical protein
LFNINIIIPNGFGFGWQWRAYITGFPADRILLASWVLTRSASISHKYSRASLPAVDLAADIVSHTVQAGASCYGKATTDLAVTAQATCPSRSLPKARAGFLWQSVQVVLVFTIHS